jgi:hypothetical protein
MGRVRSLFSITMLCVLGGIAGGLALGYVLSRHGEWLVVQPWAIYAVLLLVVTAALTWLDVRRRPGVVTGAPATPTTAAEPAQAGAPESDGEQAEYTARGAEEDGVVE